VQYLLRQKTQSSVSSAEEWTLVLSVFVIGSYVLRFGLLAHWLDGVLGPVGSGSLIAEMISFFAITALAPAVGLYVLLNRIRGPRATVAEQLPTPPIQRFLPIGVVILAALMLAGAAMTKTYPTKMDLSTIARVPVVDGGRVKPLDTVARVYLRKISAREEFVGKDGKMHPAIEWLMDTMASPLHTRGPALEHKVIRIEHPQVLSLLGLERREHYRYSLEEIAPKFQDLQTAMDKARPREGVEKPPADARIDSLFESGDRDVFAAQLMEAAERIDLYAKLCNRIIPLSLPPTDDRKWRSLGKVQQTAEQQAVMAAFAAINLLPKDFGKLSPEQQEQLQNDIEERIIRIVGSDAAAMKMIDVIAAYKSGDSSRFAKAVSEFQQTTEAGVSPVERSKAQFEVFLNEFAPTYQVIYLYVFAFLLTLTGWGAIGARPSLGQALRKSAFWLLVVAFLVHGFALFARMYLMDRPLVFVTNLYSTAVFIGWAAVGVGLIMERILPIGLGNLVAAVVGGATGIIAHNLATSSDTLEMMQAVLDTNFWLATHVTTINFGYAATFVAGVLGIVYIVFGLFTTALRKPAAVALGSTAPPGFNVGRLLGQLMYGVLCLATLLSFVGTVLGGIWADQSWGRFWGWDPKENGAILIVLWNALILHARWCGLVKDRGIAVLTLVGNMITTWSYFGTNQLGVGLHFYGFNNALATGCMITWLVHLGLIGLGLIPLRYWRSFSDSGAAHATASATLTSPVSAADPGSPQASAQPQPTATTAQGAAPATNGHIQPNGHPRPGRGKKHKKR
jgi:ABC-type transport system involved in cytochrome c biogenesis permease subunit